ncbi:hypothetical protein B0G81_6818 [Paraburkholderia sp. BL6665CI2N2]|uniref:hypothetical protein n=1 Tax=Paraburkholderia sp. BL6665CI2N2 TaxID=1938806 RepID=UPI001066D9FE|nr:hypothetical protein [Paraburkholderia sp. BL6665CI2N2]TDY26308.1 hypothetical protein B0G81_6818 [Paraburkholderia sp. BL6665CI2N2]
MTISSTANKAIRYGNGVATSFPYGFLIPNQSQLTVIVTDPLGNQTTLSPSQYSVSGIGNKTGGAVTYPLSGAALAALWSITILRTLPIVQQTDIVNQNGFYPDVVESAMDYQTMTQQQLAEIQSRSLVFPVVDDQTAISPVMPAAAVRANKAMAFDALGQPTVMVPVSGSAADVLIMLAGSAGSSMAGFIQYGVGAISRTAQDELRNVINVAQFGALANVASDQAPAIQLADTVATALGWELEFEKGQTYHASELYLSSPRINFNGATLLKTSTTSLGFVNWGNAANKTVGITDGLVRNVTIDANGQNNVVNLRLYGNHTRPKIRNLRLLNSDFYAFGVGSLTGPGDKLDQINGLDIDGVYVESYRGNAALGWGYSMGLEFFPGVTCYDWNIRNVKTKGLVVNKVHATIGVKLHNIDCEATAEFNPLSSAYFEINNCDDVDVSSTCRFRKPGTTYWACKIAGDRITGYGGTATSNNFQAYADQMAVGGAASVTLGNDARVTGSFNILGASQSLYLNGTFTGEIATANGQTLATLDMTGARAQILRLNTGTITNFRWSGGRWSMNGNNSQFIGVTSARITHVEILLTGAPQPYAIDVDGTTATDFRLSRCTMDGAGTWNRPLYISNGGVMRVTSNDITNFTSSTLLASGSQALTTVANNMVNDVLVP